MEGYQGHNSNTPYALFHLRYMDVNHALSQSDMLHTFFDNSLLDNYAPNFEKVGSILLSACPSVRLSVRPFVCPFKKKLKLGF